MAVAYANALSKRIEGSHLCCTRMEGMLKYKVSPEVEYLFLKKKNTLDFRAFWKLRKYIKQYNIDLIQAHSSSYFLAVLIKLSLPNLKLIWHDHLGRNKMHEDPGFLKPASLFFDGIFSINADVKNWAQQKLHCRKFKYVRNFIPDVATDKRMEVTLKGEDSFKLICVANLRYPKDHLNLLKAFKNLLLKNNQLSLHLVGKDIKDSYSAELNDFIMHNQLNETVFIYGAQSDIAAFLDQADLGVLSSTSEGLPVALLEYGLAGLPVVCTRVGECAEVIGSFGILVPARDPEALAVGIEQYMNDSERRKKDAEAFQKKVLKEYSEEVVIPEVLEFFKEIGNPLQALSCRRR